ncbi:DUF6477 family protein [Rhodovulum adriaticum]|uniref:Uncharacterized protein n=1 Tax=Rhodovulum adriaticum TaxID=35804 RepID=A0A4R2NWS6_RHOAD|nr:DUF6477 family protein [Rhodovulum adriaticum]MBK1636599.1 hypothetical protein [Rhodovulum adriaticum]TCP26088.1 hypothetical protein EV656_10250 [Rhodovulum adriaticum]
MTKLPRDLLTLRRPRLLVQAARAGQADYRRDRTLARLLPGNHAAPAGTLRRLMALELEMETERRAGAATYPVARHVEILIALMAEARLIGEGAPPAQ